MNRRLVYKDPDNHVEYVLVYREDDPALVQIIAPPKRDGVLIPITALEHLMSVYRLNVHHDMFEHRPVRQ